MSKDDKKICVGAIAGAFGVHGEVRLKSFCSEPEDIKRYQPLYDENDRLFTIKKIRPIKGGLSALIAEVQTREEAEALRSTRLYALRTQFPELEEDEYYQSDLIGMDVYDGHGEKLGKVKSIQNYGAGDLLEMHYKGKTALVPFSKMVVPMVDLDGRKIIIDPPDGLLE